MFMMLREIDEILKNFEAYFKNLWPREDQEDRSEYQVFQNRFYAVFDISCNS